MTPRAVLFIQQLRTIYEPHERGGAPAQRRARVPMDALLPELPPDSAYVCQKLEARGPDFELVTRRVVARETVPVEGDDFFLFHDGMTLRGSHAPPRYPKRLALDRGWMRVVLNSRNAAGGHDYNFWQYETTVINIARFDRTPVANHFATHEPTTEFDLRGQIR